MDYTIKEFKNKEARDIYDNIITDVQNIIHWQNNTTYEFELEHAIMNLADILADIFRN